MMVGQVINMRANPLANPGAVERGKEILSRLSRGELTGFFYVACGPDVDDEIGICGEFAEDIEYAERAGVACLEALFDITVKNAAVRRPLPRGLKTK